MAFITFSLGDSFFKNAGICGFARFLQDSEAVVGQDYIIDGQDLQVSRDFLLNKNIPEMYVSFIIKFFGDNTYFHKLVYEDSEVIKSLSSRITELSKDQTKTLKDLYSAFIKNFTKASFKTGYLIIQNLINSHQITAEPISADMVQELTSLSLEERYPVYENLIRLCKQTDVQRVLMFKEITYSKLKIFFDNFAWCSKNHTDIPSEEVYAFSFYEPLVTELNVSEQKKKHSCIECHGVSSQRISLSFAVGFIDDIQKKKSHYWNCKPDAYVCPLCAFVYSFAPMGFEYWGSECAFVNSNTDISVLLNLMDTYRAKNSISADESGHPRSFFHAFTSEKIDMLEMKLSNFQVISYNPNKSNHFKFSFISSDIVTKLKAGKQYLSSLENVGYLDAGSNSWVSVYDLVVDCISEKKIFYPLIDKLFRIFMQADKSVNFLSSLLKLEIIFNGGNDMAELNKKATAAFMAGIDLRSKVVTGSDDSSLRGFIYKLANSTSLGDLARFMDMIIRFYTGFGLPIPSVFKDCYTSDDMFKAISHNFILGLKYVKFNKEATTNE